MTSNTLTIIGWVVCDLRRSCRLVRIKVQIRIYSRTCQVVCNRSVSQMVGWDLLNETEYVPPMICEICQVSQSCMGHNSSHCILPPPSLLRFLVEKERMDPFFWIALSIAAGQEGGNRLNSPTGPSNYCYRTKTRDREVAEGLLHISAHLMLWACCQTVTLQVPSAFVTYWPSSIDVLGIRATT